MPSETKRERKPVVVITGSSGLIGTRVARALADDYEVLGLDRVRPAEADEGSIARWVECDLTGDASVARALAEVNERCGREIASVVHLAAYYDFSGEPSPLYRELTVKGTRRLLRGLHAFDVSQLVFSSSLLVMRSVPEGGVIDENSPIEAEWDYPRSKVEAERTIREESTASTSVILRIAGAYDDEGHSIPIAQQMRRIYERSLESYFFPGDPEHGQSFVHLDDVVDCFRATVDRRGELDPLETFLVGEPEVVSYSEMQDVIGEEIHGHEWPTIRIPPSVAKAGAWVREKTPGVDSFVRPWMVDLADAHRPISIERARAKLGWEPRHRLRDALPRMARALVESPLEWYRANGIDPPEDLEEPAVGSSKHDRSAR